MEIVSELVFVKKWVCPLHVSHCLTLDACVLPFSFDFALVATFGWHTRRTGKMTAFAISLQTVAELRVQVASFVVISDEQTMNLPFVSGAVFRIKVTQKFFGNSFGVFCPFWSSSFLLGVGRFVFRTRIWLKHQKDVYWLKFNHEIKKNKK